MSCTGPKRVEVLRDAVTIRGAAMVAGYAGLLSVTAARMLVAAADVVAKVKEMLEFLRASILGDEQSAGWPDTARQQTRAFERSKGKLNAATPVYSPRGRGAAYFGLAASGSLAELYTGRRGFAKSAEAGVDKKLIRACESAIVGRSPDMKRPPPVNGSHLCGATPSQSTY